VRIVAEPLKTYIEGPVIDQWRNPRVGRSRSQTTTRMERIRKITDEMREHDNDGYDKKQVAAFLDAAGIRLAAMESTDRPERPLVSGAILTEWAEWADSTRFSTTPPPERGHPTAEVNAFRKELRDTFLGVSQPPRPGSRNQPGPKRATTPWFSTTRGWSRPGYDVQEVDAFLSMAKLRLAAITPDIEFTLYSGTGPHRAGR
jgi:hypothetical protein